jgi:hypothetical protein
MSAFVQRCFLLLLLACDWAGDPHMGRSPLSQELGSQVVVCRTIGLQPTSVGLLSPTRQVAAPTHLTADGVAHDTVRPSLPPEGLAYRAAHLVYVHMSIRR